MIKIVKKIKFSKNEDRMKDFEIAAGYAAHKSPASNNFLSLFKPNKL